MSLQFSNSEIYKKFFRKYLAGLLLTAMGFYLPVTAADSATASVLINRTKVPKKVQDLVDNWLKDGTVDLGFNQLNNAYKLDSSIRFEDLEADIPVQQYEINTEILKSGEDTLPISRIARPLYSWQVPIRKKSNGDYILSLTIVKRNTNYFIAGACETPPKYWQRTKALWPDSSGFIPIHISDYPRSFLHFPKIDDYNLFPFSAAFGDDDSVAIAFDQSTGENKPLYTSPEVLNGKLKLGKLPPGAYLCDSRKIFKILRKKHLETKACMKKLNEMHQNKQIDSLSR
jgi:hypothetical protein